MNMSEKLQKGLIEGKHQLLGVRRPGAALACARLARLYRDKFNQTGPIGQSDQSAARPAHSKELSLSLVQGFLVCRGVTTN
jgi:hypothetical protein